MRRKECEEARRLEAGGWMEDGNRPTGESWEDPRFVKSRLLIRFTSKLEVLADESSQPLDAGSLAKIVGWRLIH